MPGIPDKAFAQAENRGSGCDHVVYEQDMFVF